VRHQYLFTTTYAPKKNLARFENISGSLTRVIGGSVLFVVAGGALRRMAFEQMVR
jgi:hypothetical protein